MTTTRILARKGSPSPVLAVDAIGDDSDDESEEDEEEN
jgi:hypothetical protein